MNSRKANRDTVKTELLKKVVSSGKPIDLFVVISTKCNLRCIMCRYDTNNSVELPEELLRERIFPLLPYVEKIEWQGGEAFMTEYYFRLLNDIHKKYPGIMHSTTTNALLIDTKWAQFLTDLGMQLNISIDSLTRENYEFIRKGGSFDKLMRNLKDLKKIMDSKETITMLSVNVVVMKRNIKELPMYVEFCRTYGISNLRFSDLDAGSPCADEFIFTGKNEEAVGELKENVEKVKAQCKEYGIRFECLFENRLKNKFVSEPVEQGHSLSGGGEKRDLPCIRPWTTLMIDCFGNVRPSCECKETIGNIYQSDLESLWNGARMQEYRQRLISGDYTGFCAERCVNGVVGKEIFELV